MYIILKWWKKQQKNKPYLWIELQDRGGGGEVILQVRNSFRVERRGERPLSPVYSITYIYFPRLAPFVVLFRCYFFFTIAFPGSEHVVGALTQPSRSPRCIRVHIILHYTACIYIYIYRYACTSVTVFRRLIDYTPLLRRSLRPEHYSDTRKRSKRRPRTFSDGNPDRIIIC